MAKLKKFLLLLALCAMTFPVIACSGDTAKNEESNSTSSNGGAQLDSSIELGEEVKGKKKDFLKKINNAILLKEGVSKYDLSTKTEIDDVSFSVSAHMMIEKTDGNISRYHVSVPVNAVHAYSDLEYVYTEQEGEKLRLEKNAFDMPSYIEDIEEAYSDEDITSIKAYRKGYVDQYVVNYSQSYVEEEMEEALDELSGAILTDCTGTFVISENSTVETLTLEFLYSGKNCTLYATRQITPNASFTFPDFSEYQKPYATSLAFAELFTAIDESQSASSHTKTLSKNGTPYFSYVLNQTSGRPEAVAQYSSLSPRYYKKGVAYQEQSFGYGESSPAFSPMLYESFYEGAIEYVSHVELLDFDLNLAEKHVSYVIKQELADQTVYKCILNDDGAELIQDVLGTYTTQKSVTYTLQKGRITSISLSSENGEPFAALTVDFSANPNLFEGVDFSTYRMLVDGSNPLTSVQASVRSAYDFENTFVNYQTGELFLKNGKKLYRLDKNHNLLNTYDLKLDFGYDFFGGFLGLDYGSIYYSAYYGYSTSSDSRVYRIDLSSGSISEAGYGLSYNYYPVAVMNGTVYYQDSYGIFSKAAYATEKNYLMSDVSFEKYDGKNRAFILSGYDQNSNYFLGSYSFSTHTLTKEYGLPHLSDSHSLLGGNMCGDGFFDEEVFRWYFTIGKTEYKPQYLNVVDMHPERHYASEELAKWQIVWETDEYVFTTYCIYAKDTGKLLYFPQKASYTFFDGGLHVWAYEIDNSETERTLYTFTF